MSKPSSFKHKKADDSAGFLLWKITSLWQKKLSVTLSELGITQTQYALLASLKWFGEKNESTTQTHLVEHSKIDKMTVSKALRKLEKNGFVKRNRAPSDNRATNVLLTLQGEKLIQKAILDIESADDVFFSCLTKGQLDTYKTLAKQIIGGNDQ